MNQPPPLDPLPPIMTPKFQRERTSAVSAARFSLWAPVLTIPANLVTAVALGGAQGAGRYLSAVTHTGVTTLVIVVGFGLGWFALLKARRVGRECIFGRAVAGIVINGLLLLSLGFVAFQIAQRLSALRD